MSEDSNGQVEYLYARAQKLTEALYRVTELLSDQEPLKWLLRRQGLQIFETLIKIKTSSPSDRVKSLNLISEDVLHLVRALGLASSGSFISEANFQVLSREYKALVDFMLSQKTNLLPEPIKTEINPIGQDIGHVSIGQSEVKKEESKRTEMSEEAPKIESIRINNPFDADPIKPAENKEGGRRERIIDFIKKKDWVSVGELADVFRGETSEKTLQRDLSGMAGEGLLLKEGEKRWRKYKLAQ